MRAIIIPIAAGLWSEFRKHSSDPIIISNGQLRSFGEYKDEIAERIQAVGYGRLDNTESNSAGFRAPRSIGKQEILPVDDEWLDAAFGQVVADLQPAILQVCGQLSRIVTKIG